MTPRDPALWQQYKDSQLAAAPVEGPEDRSLHWVVQILEYVERWADLMENCISLGSSVADCAEGTSFEADDNDPMNITLVMYQSAVSALARHWIHGDELVKWHNSRFLRADERLPPEGNLVTCSVVNTPLGKGLIVAPYSILVDGLDVFMEMRYKVIAETLFMEMERHYETYIKPTDKPHTKHCPNCGVLTDAATGRDGAKPKPNDVSICVYCAAMTRYDKNLDHVLLLIGDLRDLLDQDAESFCHIGTAWWYVRNKISTPSTTQAN